MERKQIIKKFTHVSEDGEKGSCIMVLDTLELTIDVQRLSGCAPTDDNVLAFLLQDKDVRLVIREYQQHGGEERDCYFSLRSRHGYSGCVDYWLNNYNSYGVQTTGYKLLHISCYGKINNGWRKMHIGDFVELIASFYPEYLEMNRKELLMYSKSKYAKFFMMDDSATKKISKIL